MGEVFRARDTRLNRDVAIKVLPDSLGSDTERLARFTREAQTLAALNHPNIAAIYGLEKTPDFTALVMELVEGDDLSQRIARGAIPVDEALPIAKQIADALEAAHEQGIIHRDLKPANIKVRPDGMVKVLDFGLAKAMEPVGRPPNVSQSPTITTPAMMTGVGVILGTAAYMSPEQAKGRPADKRSDIWAFGCVLFEMLTGRRVFGGEDVADTMALVLTKEPQWTLLPPETPPSIRRLLRRCLERDRIRRLADMADARLEVDDALTAAEDVPTPLPTRSRRGPWLLGLVAAALTAIVLLQLRAGSSSSNVASPLRVSRLTDLAGLEEVPAFSPDGRSVAFTAGVDGSRQIFVQLIAGGPPLAITRDPVDHQYPRWSPDASSIVFFSPARPGEAQGALWEISALGGSPRRITDSIGGGDVNTGDGRIAFFWRANAGLELVTAGRDGSNAEVVTELEAVRYYLYPRWSPDGRWIAFQRGDGVRFDLDVVSARGGEPRQVTRENATMNGFAWMPDSASILYSSSRGSSMPYLPAMALWLVQVGDGDVRQVTSSGESSYLQPDVTRTGAIVAGRMHMQSDIWKFPVDGSAVENVARAARITRQTGQVLAPSAAPGDKEVAFLSDSGGHANLWVVNTETGELRQITRERDPGVAVGAPIWSPDGRAIAFVSTRGNPGLTFGVWLVSPDGSNLRSIANPALGAAWSHDGRWVYFSTRGSATTEAALKKIAVGGGEAVTVTTERLRNVIGSDGSTLYYVFERPLVDGTPEFEIRAATPEDGPFRVVARIPPGRVPVWQIVNPALSPDGRWLAQALTDGFTTNIWALSTATGEWRQITDFGGRATLIARRVSWSSDGRFVYAAVGEADADIVMLDGLLPASRN